MDLKDKELDGGRKRVCPKRTSVRMINHLTVLPGVSGSEWDPNTD